MKNSAQRILTTHVGSLPRPADLLRMILAKEQGEPFDPQSYLPAITGYYSTAKGEMLSFPFNSSSMVLWVNLDALKDAGIADLFERARRIEERRQTR